MRALKKRVKRLELKLMAGGKVGKLIRCIGHTFGVEIEDEMSRRTVSRANLEGGVAARLQVAYEVLNTNGEYPSYLFLREHPHNFPFRFDSGPR
ncbi:hypothetical protein K435DRAFT_777007 [Dendrothele bispora CBS 962.96]|uniref:Uncharacterized protein n=1 Tax=Dendrothele bispora (strain CBS 962.96) TaxID=1314807 RepID=A0A4V4HGM2_DENBC|nr:hypothetical protein K435DRAFT_777007 [Dendrothele bispora CBS 962.96]